MGNLASKRRFQPVKNTKEFVGFKNKEKHYIFLPVDVRIKARELSSLNVMGGSVDFRGKLRIEFPKYPPALKEDLQEKLKISLCHKKGFLTLTRGTAKCEELDSGALVLTCEFYSEVLWTPNLRCFPLDVQNIPVSIEIAQLKKGKYRYYFNILDKGEKYKKEFFLPGIHLHMLEDFLLSSCQKRYELVKTIIGGKKIEYTQQITLNFALLRNPCSSLLKLLLPSFIFQLLGLILFFTNEEYNARVVNILVLILGIVAFLPTLRAGLPNVPYMTLIDCIILSSILNIGICLFATSIDQGEEGTVWFIFACAQVFLTSIVIGLWIFFRSITIWGKSFLRKFKIEKEFFANTNKNSRLEVYDSIPYDELERPGRGEQAVAPIGIVLPRSSAESRQSQELGQNRVVEPSKRESLACMEKCYVANGVELTEGTKESLKSINEIP